MTTLTREQDVCVLGVEGELNKATVSQFQELVDQCLAQDARDFVVDLLDCTGIDSAGLETLTRLNRTCQEKLGMAKLCNLSESMEKIMEITRLRNELDQCVTLEDALAALK
ncbi:MAG TPA: STAS domain-containing protein [Phycisphaerae bacterium]|nr:STAS domain-containing protein [Phycisphaerales bacterium]HRX83526.1 STAS domain-containing protein [Phycisphaerae bacterium]